VNPATQEAPVFIYGLRDPRDERIRYVGKTRRPLRARLNGHLGEVKRWPKSAKSEWIAELATSGLLPQIVELERCAPGAGREVEAALIRKHSLSGDALNVNLRDGLLEEGVFVRMKPCEQRFLSDAAGASGVPRFLRSGGIRWAEEILGTTLEAYEKRQGKGGTSK
jgi:hypothetical protein